MFRETALVASTQSRLEGKPQGQGTKEESVAVVQDGDGIESCGPGNRMEGWL